MKLACFNKFKIACMNFLREFDTGGKVKKEMLLMRIEY